MSDTEKAMTSDDSSLEGFIHLREEPPVPDYAGAWVVGGGATPLDGGLSLTTLERPSWVLRNLSHRILPIRWFDGYWVDRGLPRPRWVVRVKA